MDVDKLGAAIRVAYSKLSIDNKKKLIRTCIEILDPGSKLEDVHDELPLLIARLNECGDNPLEGDD